MWTMGIDMGTSGCKAVVFDEKWNVVSNAYSEYGLDMPGAGLLELDSEVVWENICHVIRLANQNIKQPVEAIAISAIGDVIVPMGENGKQVCNSIVDFDPRGAEEIEEFVEEFGRERFFELTGMPPLYIGSLAKILWFKHKKPKTFQKVKRWATYEDFIVGKFGLEPCASYGEAARTMLLDIRKKEWCHEIIDRVGIREDQLPKVLPSATQIGYMPKEQAQNLGFTKPVMVVTGGHDMICAAVGAGLDERQQNVAVDISGTIEGLVAVLPEANTSPEMLKNALPCYPGHRGYVTFSVNLTAGCIVRWFRDNMVPDTSRHCKEFGGSVFDHILSTLDADRPGNLLFLPHFAGTGTPYFDPNAQGVLYGTTLYTTRLDMARAMFEGLAFELRTHTEALRDSGVHLTTLLAVGGGNRVPKQLQMKANILNLDIMRGTITESGALGAAAYAATAMGVLEDPADAYLAIKDNEKTYKAKPNKLFDEAYAKYSALSRAIHAFEMENL